MGKDLQIQLQLVSELMHFKDTPSAARWAVRCALPTNALPYTLQTYLSKHRDR